jgi:hypothetical protein
MAQAKQLTRSKTAGEADSTYAPSEEDRFNEGDEGVEDNWEVGACTWGILTTTGLGVVSAGVFGAEIVAR